MSTAQDAAQEALIQSAGATVAARLTPAQIDAAIAGEYYFTAQNGVDSASPLQAAPNDHDVSLGLLTFCVLVLRNGFTVTGQSACASPENFNAEVGRQIARDDAREKIWMLEGYLLKQRLFDATPPVSEQEGGA